MKKKLEDGGTETDKSKIKRNFMIAFSLLTFLHSFDVLLFYATATHSDYPTGNYAQDVRTDLMPPHPSNNVDKKL